MSDFVFPVVGDGLLSSVLKDLSFFVSRLSLRRMCTGEKSETRGGRLEKKGGGVRKGSEGGSAWEGGMIVRGAETVAEQARGRGGGGGSSRGAAAAAAAAVLPLSLHPRIDRQSEEEREKTRRRPTVPPQQKVPAAAAAQVEAQTPASRYATSQCLHLRPCSSESLSGVRSSSRQELEELLRVERVCV